MYKLTENNNWNQGFIPTISILAEIYDNNFRSLNQKKGEGGPVPENLCHCFHEKKKVFPKKMESTKRSLYPTAVLEMKILIYWSNSKSWIYFIYRNKNWKIYWFEQSFTDLGQEGRCSLWGLWMRWRQHIKYICP